MEFIQCPITNCTRKIKAHNWKSNMSDHLQTHDTERTLVYHCTYEGCGKSYMRENSVKDCVRKHQGDKFQCETCKKGFGDRNEREKHRLVAKKCPDECVPVVENDV
ncbi:hypothetical protein BCR33DRAFT_745295 [Rhizoclosmatium globosum]|uniref:C2H2-type domain-containing protein n=1 Tax=Rhizoclosmatium globosum TaxID=329046 RepID=A0A1Y2B3Q1_9FUNG|nr:hypothetical protein BCR33DRAFT_745295 [Rhizoclosmatium globosum]|eukprot:ORY29459.1 hypothetical protein BCR33DRAFT_745295 [Rhizoclosmatium globosum]